MMDRIEDETVRFLYFLQVNTGSAPVMPFPDEDDDSGPTSSDGERALYGSYDPGTGKTADQGAQRPDASEQQRVAARTSMEDFTRNVQRKKEREMAELQFVGGEASSAPQQVVAGAKVGRNDPCPCGSGKKYKKCHGS